MANSPFVETADHFLYGWPMVIACTIGLNIHSINRSQVPCVVR